MLVRIMNIYNFISLGSLTSGRLRNTEKETL